MRFTAVFGVPQSGDNTILCDGTCSEQSSLRARVAASACHTDPAQWAHNEMEYASQLHVTNERGTRTCRRRAAAVRARELDQTAYQQRQKGLHLHEAAREVLDSGDLALSSSAKDRLRSDPRRAARKALQPALTTHTYDAPAAKPNHGRAAPAEPCDSRIAFTTSKKSHTRRHATSSCGTRARDRVTAGGNACTTGHRRQPTSTQGLVHKIGTADGATHGYRHCRQGSRK
jgi:hypothetical protein